MTLLLRLAWVVPLAMAAVVIEHAPFLLGRRVPGRPLEGRAPEPPASWAPWVRTPPNPVVACLESLAFLAKFLVFLAFAAHVGDLDPEDGRSQALATASRVCVGADVALSAMLGALFGLRCGSLPNVFPGDGLGGRRNRLAAHLMLFGGAIGGLGVGLRGLRRGDVGVDECLAAGLSAQPRLLAAVLLDVPHLVLGVMLLASNAVLAGPSGEGQPARGAFALGVAAAAAAVSGLILATKTCLVDVRWFWYGAEYRRRAAYLTQKGYASARWSMMSSNMRKAKHEVRLRREELESAELTTQAGQRTRQKSS